MKVVQVNMDYSKVPSLEVIDKTIIALKDHGVKVILADSKEQALEEIKKSIPEGSKIMNGSSTTLIQIGFSEMLKSGNHKWKNLHEDILKEKDYGKQSDLRRKALTKTDYF
ncbi:lactate utilization protein, partial [Candidatus Roizmanbacteria bacterium CG_4_10_14_0_2_um_filter_33_96]